MQKRYIGLIVLVVLFLIGISSYCPSLTGLHIVPTNVGQEEVVAYWPIDEGYGTLMRDVSVDIIDPRGFSVHNHKKNENHGTLQNVQWMTSHTECIHGVCLYLDGKESQIHFKQQHDFPISNHEVFTLMFWIRGKPQQQKSIYVETVKEERTEFIALRTEKEEGKIAFVVGTQGEQYEYLSKTIVFDNLWHHIVFMYDHGKGQWFIDGNAEEVFDVSLPLQKRTMTTIGVRLEQELTEFFEGYIGGDFKVYQRNVSPEEIQYAAEGSCARILPIDFGSSGSLGTAKSSTGGGTRPPGGRR